MSGENNDRSASLQGELITEEKSQIDFIIFFPITYSIFLNVAICNKS